MREKNILPSRAPVVASPDGLGVGAAALDVGPGEGGDPRDVAQHLQLVHGDREPRTQGTDLLGARTVDQPDALDVQPSGPAKPKEAGSQ